MTFILFEEHKIELPLKKFNGFSKYALSSLNLEGLEGLYNFDFGCTEGAVYKTKLYFNYLWPHLVDLYNFSKLINLVNTYVQKNCIALIGLDQTWHVNFVLLLTSSNCVLNNQENGLSNMWIWALEISYQKQRKEQYLMLFFKHNSSLTRKMMGILISVSFVTTISS